VKANTYYKKLQTTMFLAQDDLPTATIKITFDDLSDDIKSLMIVVYIFIITLDGVLRTLGAEITCRDRAASDT
jgi:hypothetical protein